MAIAQTMMVPLMMAGIVATAWLAYDAVKDA